MHSVFIVQEHLPHYRVAFYEVLRESLLASNVFLQLAYHPNPASNLIAGQVPWATPIPIIRFGKLAWQPVLNTAAKSDLVVVQQESKYLASYFLLLKRLVAPSFRLAFWGHGRNFQSEHSNSLSEHLKRIVSIRCDWWFAYNTLSSAIIQDLGFPKTRITSVMNSVDTTNLLRMAAEFNPAESQSALKKLGISSSNICVYTGGLYKEKRLPFLLQSAKLIRESIKDFHLVIIGGGPLKDLVVAAARDFPFIHYVGPKNDREKLPYWMAAKALLMPGAVGLVILDCFALGVPIVTCKTFGHGPEIDYLKPGINGILVDNGDSVECYSKAVVEILSDEKKRTSLIDCGRNECAALNVENMAANFSAGILKALDTPPASQLSLFKGFQGNKMACAVPCV